MESSRQWIETGVSLTGPKMNRTAYTGLQSFLFFCLEAGRMEYCENETWQDSDNAAQEISGLFVENCTRLVATNI